MQRSAIFVGLAFSTFCSSVTFAAQELTISEIQGVGHTSPVVGEFIRTTGVVTLLTGENNFFLQGEPDGDALTSDGILVRAARKLGVKIGDKVTIEGTVTEDEGRYPQLSTTLIGDTVVLSRTENVGVPAPLVIGTTGRLPPTELSYQPGHDYDPDRIGADFYESIEGMLVAIKSPIVAGPTSADEQGRFYVLPENGDHATNANSLGGVTIAPGDSNPERIKVQATKADTQILQVAVGDKFEELVGVITYDSFGSYGITLKTFSGYEPLTRPSPKVVAAGDGELDIVSYNVENLDPVKERLDKVYRQAEIDDDVADLKFDGIATHIVDVLGEPAIVALQEVQDNDGAEYSDVSAGDQTLAMLAGSIKAAGGPDYIGLELAPPDDEGGGQRGANIHAAFLYDPARVTPSQAEMTFIEGPAFARSRLPLAVPFEFGDHRVWVINVHLSSKIGGDPDYGTVQPPRDVSLPRRIEQARAVRDFIRDLPADHRVVVVGDFNAYWFEPPMLLLTGGQPALENLALRDPPEERISYVFDGSSQSLDHVLVHLQEGDKAVLSTPHVNSIFPVVGRMSDHDPKHVVLSFAR